MDFQNRPGGKTGGGGQASWTETNKDRRERLRQLALETIDINKDPYFMKNHLGSYECKLCLTLHNNEGSYLAHTQGKKHQANLARRAAKEAKEAPQQPAPEKPRVETRKFVKIGRPGYRVTKQRDADSGQQSLLFQIDYPEIAENINPRHRFMSAYEQKVEPPDRKWQYLLFAAEPYETIAFKVPSREVDKSESRFFTMWNKETKQFFLQFSFKVELKPKPPPSQGPPASLPPPPRPQGPPALPPPPMPPQMMHPMPPHGHGPPGPPGPPFGPPRPPPMNHFSPFPPPLPPPHMGHPGPHPGMPPRPPPPHMMHPRMHMQDNQFHPQQQHPHDMRPPMGGPQMGGPPMGGPQMGGPPMGGPQMGGPPMGGPQMGGPQMGGPPMGGPQMGGPPMRPPPPPPPPNQMMRPPHPSQPPPPPR